ncbi:hypothetical protein CAT7_06216 [Carnobacterium sp. AT7]|uniref:GrpB family protein n=1 Tax=Carnobacterium TaxID=2747 RepID=UPI00015F1CCD|nr:MULTISPECIES: GrpB family protein [Carnobacterium]EDP69093.1 hypothetical protein CAT7_06216 [Carnobacterium sp. AT7]
MKIKVVEYREEWSKLFQVESKKIQDIFGKELIAIHHIGSTSVPHLNAKPIIDIMPIVKKIEHVDSFNIQMSKIGYEPLGEYGIEGRRFFRKGGDQRTHHIHVFQNTNKNDMERHLAVRDYLRTHYEARRDYGNLKRELAIKFPNNINSYSDGKDEFVKNLERKALLWYLEK